MRRLRAALWRYRELVALWGLAAALVLVQLGAPSAWPGTQPLPLPPASRGSAPTWLPTTTTPQGGPGSSTTSTTRPTAPTTVVGPVPPSAPPPTTTTLPATTLPTTLPALPTTTACLRPGPPDPPPVTWRGPPLVSTTVGHDQPRCRPAP